MLQAEFLQNSRQRLKRLADDPHFATERGQLRAKSVLLELSDGERSELPRFNFSEGRLWRNCHFVLSSISREITHSGTASDDSQRAARLAAETAEYLSKSADTVDRDRARVVASLLYHLAGYEASGTCMARRTLDFISGDEEPAITRGVTGFLLREFATLRDYASGARPILLGREGELRLRPEGDEAHPDDILNLAANIHAMIALLHVASFALAGTEGDFTAALEAFDDSTQLFSASGDADPAVMVNATRAALLMMHERSTWHLIRQRGLADDDLWRSYLRVLAVGDLRQSSPRSVVEFWPSQRKAIDSGLLDENNGLIIRMPTSSGKTRIAELAIVDSLHKDPESRCVYVAPYRALAEEVEQSLDRSIGRIGFSVSRLIGGFDTDAFEGYVLNHTDVLILTPEKLDLLYRAQPSYFDSVSLIVVDEGHILGDAGRGAQYELLLTRLKRRSKRTNTRFLFISAVIQESNARQIAAWLAGDRERVATSDWRPARQLLARFYWVGSRGRADYVNPPGAEPFSQFVPRLIDREEFLDVTPRTRQPKRVMFPSASKAATAAALAMRFADSGQVLVFCAQTNWVRSVAENILTGLRLRNQSGAGTPDALRSGQTSASLTMAEEWLGSSHILARALRHGVGIHHGRLPEAVRVAVEDDFRSGHIHVLVSTNTLAQGVNLPITTAIVHSVTRQSGEPGRREQIPVRDYWNICGRAGRAGVETQGQILFLVDSPYDQALFNYYQDLSNVETIESRLLVALRMIVTGRLPQEQLQTQLDSDLLALIVEESIETVDRSLIESVVGDSLAMIQAIDNNESLSPLISNLVEMGNTIVRRLPSADVRSLCSVTGLSVASCSHLLETLELQMPQLTNAVSGGDVEEIVRLAFAACSDLREMRPSVSVEVDILPLLFEWIRGTPAIDMWKPYSERGQSSGENSENNELLSRFVEDYFVFRLPWGFYAYLTLAQRYIGQTSTISSSIRYIASFVKYGLPDPVACWARSLGIPTRSVSLVLANGYRKDGGVENFGEFVRWLVELSQDDLMARFGMDGDTLAAVLGKLNRVAGILRVRGNFGRREIVFEVRGLQYRGRRERAAGLAVGDVLVLDRESENRFDPSAVRVLRNNEVIGYVPREIARSLLPSLEGRETMRARVTEIFASDIGAGPSRLMAATIVG